MKRLIVKAIADYGFIALLVLFILAGIIGATRANAQDTDPATLLIPAPVATPIQIHLEWGQEFHIFCSQDSKDAQPSGILSMESTGSDQWNGDCRPPGTVVDDAP
jgi:hypothetical protein